jgi:2'-hydroxyisoflavone reductase
MPVWVPAGTDSSGITQVDCSRAIAKGLKFRPVEETAADTLAWWKTEPEERRAKLKAGLSPERETEVLKALRSPS